MLANSLFVNVLHVSDIQAGANSLAKLPIGLVRPDGYDEPSRYQYYANLIAIDAASCVEQKGRGKINLLAVTGDIVETASAVDKNEYDMATVFLSELSEKLELPRENVCIVPGNHDVDWSCLEAAYPHVPPDPFNREECADIAAKMDAFAAWLSAFYGVDTTACYTYGQPLVYTPTDIGPLRIVGLDTTEGNTYDVEGVANRGFVKQKQLDTAGRHLNTGKKSIKVVLMHHNPFPQGDEPRQTGLEDEARVIQGLKGYGVHLVLAGHMHRGRDVIHTEPGAGHLQAMCTLITGPCCMQYEGRTFHFGEQEEVLPNRYEIISINTHTGLASAILRRFSFEKLAEGGARGAWTKDTDLHYADEYGEKVFRLPSYSPWDTYAKVFGEPTPEFASRVKGDIVTGGTA